MDNMKCEFTSVVSLTLVCSAWPVQYIFLQNVIHQKLNFHSVTWLESWGQRSRSLWLHETLLCLVNTLPRENLTRIILNFTHKLTWTHGLADYIWEVRGHAAVVAVLYSVCLMCVVRVSLKTLCRPPTERIHSEKLFSLRRSPSPQTGSVALPSPQVVFLKDIVCYLSPAGEGDAGGQAGVWSDRGCGRRAGSPQRGRGDVGREQLSVAMCVYAPASSVQLSGARHSGWQQEEWGCSILLLLPRASDTPPTPGRSVTRFNPAAPNWLLLSLSDEANLC